MCRDFFYVVLLMSITADATVLFVYQAITNKLATKY